MHVFKIRQLEDLSNLTFCQLSTWSGFSYFVLRMFTKVHRSEKTAKSHSPTVALCTILCLHRHSRGSCKITPARGPTVRRTRFVLPSLESNVHAKARFVGRCTNGCRICGSRLRTDARRWILHLGAFWETHRTCHPRKVSFRWEFCRPRRCCKTRLGALSMDGRGSWLAVYTVQSIFFDRSSSRGSFG